MTDLITGAIARLRDISRESGVEDGTVAFSTDPDVVICQYERGVCMIASFGGRTSEFVTDEPTIALTKIGYVFDAILESPRIRAAAAAIAGVVTGFLLLNRIMKSCLPENHVSCLAELSGSVRGKSLYCVGDTRRIPDEFGRLVVKEPGSADIILVTGAGMCTTEGLAVIERYRGKKRIVFLGPSPSGVCVLEKLEHWCPYGRM